MGVEGPASLPTTSSRASIRRHAVGELKAPSAGAAQQARTMGRRRSAGGAAVGGLLPTPRGDRVLELTHRLLQQGPGLGPGVGVVDLGGSSRRFWFGRAPPDL